MTTVTLNAGYYWRCPSCNTLNTCDPVPMEVPAGDAKYELADQYAMDPDTIVTGRFSSHPGDVECERCAAAFGTTLAD